MPHVIPAHQTRISDDPIFALNREAMTRKGRGEHVVNATVGALLDDAGKLVILPSAARAVHEVPPEDWAPYAPIAGTADFLAAVVDDLFGAEPAMRQSALSVATPGGSGALHLAIANYLERGQSLLTANYYWGPYETLCDEAERKLATFSMFAADGSLDVAALDRALAEQITSQRRVLLFINDPCNNPTGYSMRPDEWRAVVERLVARSSDAPITLLVDMAYFAYGAQESRAFLAELRPLLGKVGLLFAWSASKTYTHYGLRVGALVACVPDAAERASTDAALSYSCRGTWSNCSRGGMRAITRLLTDPTLASSCDRERDEQKAILGARVSAFNEAARARGLRYPRYEGGFFVTVFMDDAAGRARRMKEQGVFVVPQRDAVRVALCSVAVADVPRLVDVLAS